MKSSSSDSLISTIFLSIILIIILALSLYKIFYNLIFTQSYGKMNYSLMILIFIISGSFIAGLKSFQQLYNAYLQIFRFRIKQKWILKPLESQPEQLKKSQKSIQSKKKTKKQSKRWKKQFFNEIEDDLETANFRKKQSILMTRNSVHNNYTQLMKQRKQHYQDQYVESDKRFKQTLKQNKISKQQIGELIKKIKGHTRKQIEKILSIHEKNIQDIQKLIQSSFKIRVQKSSSEKIYEDKKHLLSVSQDEMLDEIKKFLNRKNKGVIWDFYDISQKYNILKKLITLAETRIQIDSFLSSNLEITQRQRKQILSKIKKVLGTQQDDQWQNFQFQFDFLEQKSKLQENQVFVHVITKLMNQIAKNKNYPPQKFFQESSNHESGYFIKTSKISGIKHYDLIYRINKASKTFFCAPGKENIWTLMAIYLKQALVRNK